MCENIQLMWAVIRIGIYSLFRRICCGGSPPVKPNYTVICIGLSKSGKSSILAKLSGESTDNIEPTIGFSIKALIFDNCFLDVKELGGGDNVRPYWDRYYLGTQGIIFVVNSAGSEEELNTTKEEFRKVMENEQLEGFPLLVLCNHQDQEAARSTDEITKLLNLEKQTGERPWAVHGTSANDKSSIKAGFEKLNKFLLEPYNPTTNSKDGFDRL
ncbi:hypothetical protein CHS0354_029269 [Potamilus streckersoni]|uniref:ADP-ribosylation factor-like protein 15 n=1 Tax=Potamilus streckersoni TaxID=2493646 RepID=A0AAE0T0K6_9BIVA|nr:hypothetical protein CHS0354_029269 [Potamilus streckersoni]